MKPTDKPDSVHEGFPSRDHHYSGPPVARTARCYLPAHSGGPVNVCLLGIAARRDCPFHLRARAATCAASESKTRLCCSNPHLRILRPVGGQPLAATLPYAVRTFLQCSVSRIAPAVVWRASRPDYRLRRIVHIHIPEPVEKLAHNHATKSHFRSHHEL